MLGRYEKSDSNSLAVLTPERQIRGVYKKLSICLDVIEEQLVHLEDTASRSCLIVLEDDLLCLVEECEECLVCPDSAEPHAIVSLQSRGETVIGEIKHLLRD